MELALSPEQEEIRKLVSEFAEREVKPRAEAIDHSGEFPRDLVRKAADLGLLGILVPEEYGGGGLDPNSLPVFFREGGCSFARPPGILSLPNTLRAGALPLFCHEGQR